jgi:hypothetical protein
MAIYTVHCPPVSKAATAEDKSRIDKIIFLRDGFCFPAFFFGPLWLLWRGAWVMAMLWLLVAIGWIFVSLKLGVPSEAVLSLSLVFAAWFGFEATHLFALILERRGYVARDLVVSDSDEEAEEVFFSRWRNSDLLPAGSEQNA